MTRLLTPVLAVCLFASSISVRADITINLNGGEFYSDANGFSKVKNVNLPGGIAVNVNGKPLQEATTVKSDTQPQRYREFKPREVRLSPNKKQFDQLIQSTAIRNQVDPKLVHAVIHAESSYNPSAISPAGAVGLMQLMPGTAARFGVTDRYDPIQNLDGGTRYLKHLLTLFDSDLRLAVAAYNAGEHAVIRHHYDVPPYAETQNYVSRVLSLHQNPNEIVYTNMPRQFNRSMRVVKWNDDSPPYTEKLSYRNPGSSLHQNRDKTAHTKAPRRYHRSSRVIRWDQNY